MNCKLIHYSTDYVYDGFERKKPAYKMEFQKEIIYYLFQIRTSNFTETTL